MAEHTNSEKAVLKSDNCSAVNEAVFGQARLAITCISSSEESVP